MHLRRCPHLPLRDLNRHVTTALLSSLFFTFEDGMITHPHYVLLDSPLSIGPGSIGAAPVNGECSALKNNRFIDKVSSGWAHFNGFSKCSHDAGFAPRTRP